MLKVEILPLPKTFPTVKTTHHHINVRGHKPIRQRFRRVSPRKYRLICKEVDTMLESQAIENSKSPWSSPIVMVPKASGAYRFCIDFREVNEVSDKDAYPLPVMETILEQLRHARYLSTIDLSQAYFQVPLARESREITAFAVPGKGHFQFRVMPYGLTGAPATFQRLIDSVIAELDGRAFAYLDDIIVISDTFEEHLELVRTVLSRLRETGLAINAKKSHFCRPEVSYLGFRVNQEGVRTDPEKVRPVLEIPEPTTAKQVKSFISTMSWYRRYIPELATIIEPISRLVKDDVKWQWGSEQREAFHRVRRALTEAPVLTSSDFSEPFALQTSAKTKSRRSGGHINTTPGWTHPNN